MKRIMHAGAIALVLISLGASPDRAQSTDAQSPAGSAGGAAIIPSGQKFIMRLETALHTRTTRKGDRVEFTTAADIKVDDQVVIPSNSQVHATVVKSKRAGLIHGKAEIRLRFDEVRLADGTTIPLHALITRAGFDPVDPATSGDPTLKGESGAGGDIGAIASGGAQGAIIGVLSGGARGAIYGSAIGAGVAAAGMIFKRGPDLDLPRSTMFEAKFDQSLEVPAASLPHPEPATTVASAAAPTAAQSSSIPVPSAATTEEPRSQPRPRLVRRDGAGSTPPPAGAPPAAKPAEAPPAAEPPVLPKEADAAGAGAHKISVAVRMVQVDAVVKDRGGHMIDNLTRDDFLVFEDGVQQNLQSFSRDELPLAVALVIDRSGSESPYIAELRRIAERTLRQLKPQDEVALFSFANDVERLEDLTTDRQRIADSLARVRGGGGTNIVDALYQSVNYLAKAAPDLRHAVILISDNQNTVHPNASEGVTIRDAMESETVIYSIKTAGQGTPLTMQLPSIFMGSGSVEKITTETGGETIDARSTGALDGALGEVISRLRMRYSLGYYPSKPGQGEFHTIVVRLADRLGKPGSDYFIHARRGYYSTDAGQKP